MQFRSLISVLKLRRDRREDYMRVGESKARLCVFLRVVIDLGLQKQWTGLGKAKINLVLRIKSCMTTHHDLSI